MELLDGEGERVPVGLAEQDADHPGALAAQRAVQVQLDGAAARDVQSGDRHRREAERGELGAGRAASREARRRARAEAGQIDLQTHLPGEIAAIREPDLAQNLKSLHQACLGGERPIGMLGAAGTAVVRARAEDGVRRQRNLLAQRPDRDRRHVPSRKLDGAQPGTVHVESGVAEGEPAQRPRQCAEVP